jgi:hypothetical protein
MELLRMINAKVVPTMPVLGGLAKMLIATPALPPEAGR